MVATFVTLALSNCPKSHHQNSPHLYLSLEYRGGCRVLQKNAGYSGLLGQPARDILDRIVIESPVKVSGDVTDMRRGQDIIQRPERVIRRQRFDVEHVERRAGDTAFT